MACCHWLLLLHELIAPLKLITSAPKRATPMLCNRPRAYHAVPGGFGVSRPNWVKLKNVSTILKYYD